jgi:hypothetical protein
MISRSTKVAPSRRATSCATSPPPLANWRDTVTTGMGLTSIRKVRHYGPRRPNVPADGT